MKTWSFQNVCIILMIFMLLVFSVHLFAIKDQYNKQERFSRELLAHAEDVSTQLLDATKEVENEDINRCDENSLDTIRKITHKYLYVYDLGIVENDAIICTANWGRLPYPASLPMDFYTTKSGFFLYSMVPGIFPITLELDITRRKNIAAFTAYFAFQTFLTSDEGFSFSIETTTDNHAFIYYESPDQKTTWVDFPFLDDLVVNTSLCSNIYSYCVHTFNYRSGLLYYDKAFVFLTLLFSFMLSYVVFYAVSSYLYNKNSMEYRLRRAILNRRLHMEYQPILSLKTSEIVGVESLVRWDDEVYGRVSPELFVSISEKIKLYKYVAYQTAAFSIDEMASILRERKDFFLSINVSTYEITENSFLEYLKAKVVDNGIDVHQVKIEITEKIAVSLSVLSDFSNRARHYGFRVSLDDFGTGVSNLVWLTEINFNDIKIDRVFTQSLNDDFKKIMVFSIINLVSGLDKQLIFEGVENIDELELIREYCDDAYVQGWYFYKSMPKVELSKVLDASF
ncbi:EAL domain-containing protein [Nitrincola sp.]|uniref:EAL domain-containing protein n=1 Tax=Nitrincola sp. TaxID=1926584 RepID=UPI003A8FC4D8